MDTSKIPVVRTASFRTYTGPGRISIARYAPRNTPKGFKIFSKLAPGSWFNSVTWAEYVPRYNTEILGVLNAKTVLEQLQQLAGEGNIPTLLCWEVPPLVGDNQCHRRLAAAWLERELGIEVPEYEPEPVKQSDVAIPPRLRRGQITLQFGGSSGAK
ncbi:hypothetical protein EKK58_05560 [Candidatus Dependentiae bacterium]|nr:MAG: hypothetical protein EKK58_05560 [Candidatus Dependentiae bacterium]